MFGVGVGPKTHRRECQKIGSETYVSLLVLLLVVLLLVPLKKK